MALLLLAGCSPEISTRDAPASLSNTSSSPPLFEDRAQAAGVVALHRSGRSGALHMPEILGAGIALFDFDRDGDLDLYVVQSGPLDASGRATSSGDFLFRNDLDRAGAGALSFVDASELLPPRSRGYGMGVATGDYDGDGWTDLYITCWGENQLLRNEAGRRFVDVTAQSGAGDPSWSVSATFLDFDDDGALDLYVGNYVDYDLLNAASCEDRTGATDYCGPGRYRFQADRLFRSRGDGRFVDVSTEAGVATVTEPALGVLAADFDDDGLVDIYVANDARANTLWRNRGDGTFEDVAPIGGSAVNGQGQPEGSMGLDAQDYDGDGDLDLFMTHLIRESNTLFVNNGSGLFRDGSRAAGLAAPSQPYTSFGLASLDYDLDGELDLLIANGSIANLAELVRRGDPFPFHQPNQLFRNLGGGRFAEVELHADSPILRSRVSRGVAVGDIDNDGDQDLVVSNNEGPMELLINRSRMARWIGIRLTDRHGRPIAGSGTRVALVENVAGVENVGNAQNADSGENARAVRWRRAGSDGSYASASDSRVSISAAGLGPDLGVLVRWSDGSRELWAQVAENAYVDLARGSGVPFEGNL